MKVSNSQKSGKTDDGISRETLNNWQRKDAARKSGEAKHRDQDPAALRDAAATSVRAALSGDPGQQAAATDKAAEALAKAQNVPVDQAKAQMVQYQQQYKEMVAKAKQQAKEAADATAKAVSRGALFGALALLLGALAAFFAGQAGAVVPTVSSPKAAR
jgi:hypothetical protein